LSGPAILQISSYWQNGNSVKINLAPNTDIARVLLDSKRSNPKQEIATVLNTLLPKRLVEHWLEQNARLADTSDKKLLEIASRINSWNVEPSGTEGYRTAEVTLGGVDTNELSAKTMECKKVAGLFFIGEVVDVTGHLGGFNFQWAWSSGFAAGSSA
jgi:predicted Rossmann fold flavoprotein